jgi:hypothetical protein
MILKLLGALRSTALPQPTGHDISELVFIRFYIWSDYLMSILFFFITAHAWILRVNLAVMGGIVCKGRLLILSKQLSYPKSHSPPKTQS